MNTTTVVKTEEAQNLSTQTPTRTRPAHLSTDRAVEKYLELRNKIADLKKQQAQELAPYTAALAAVGGWLLDDLNQAHVEAMRASAGTFYKTLRVSAKVVNWSETLDYIRDNQAWDLLEARVSKLAVQAVMEDTQAPVPGVAVTSEIMLNVRTA